jgi:biopolymer transport protein ExbD
MRFRRKRRAPVEIGLIPMIDVLLVLLFFFMVATTFRHHSDLKINLPEAEGIEVLEETKAVNLYIDAKGAYSLDDEKSKPQALAEQTPQALKYLLSQLSPEAKKLPLIISADGQTPHQAVITALDAANQSGIFNITFAFNPSGK